MAITKKALLKFHTKNKVHGRSTITRRLEWLIDQAILAEFNPDLANNGFGCAFEVLNSTNLSQINECVIKTLRKKYEAAGWEFSINSFIGGRLEKITLR